MSEQLVSRSVDVSDLFDPGQYINGYYSNSKTASTFIDEGLVFTNNLHRKIQMFDRVLDAEDALHTATSDEARERAATLLEDAEDAAYFTCISLTDTTKNLLFGLRTQVPELWQSVVDRAQGDESRLGAMGRRKPSGMRIATSGARKEQSTNSLGWGILMHDVFTVLDHMTPDGLTKSDVEALCL